MTHTKEPWVYSQSGSQCWEIGGWVIGADGKRVCMPEAVMSRDDDENQANARRIVACVNACEGIPNEVLQAGNGIPDAVRHFQQQRDELLEIVKAVQAGAEFTPEFCHQIDATIERIDAAK